MSPPPMAAPTAEAPNAIVDSQVKASVVACRGAMVPTRELCTVSVGAIAVPPRKSSTPSTHGLDTAASGTMPIVTPSRPHRYWRGSDVDTTRAPNHRPPATDPSDHTASRTPDMPGEPAWSANAGTATSRAPKPSIRAEPLISTRGMPGASTVENSPVRASAGAGTHDRIAAEKDSPRAPTTARTPATASTIAGEPSTVIAATAVGPVTNTNSVAVASSA